MVGVVLAGAGVVEMVLGLTRNDSPAARDPGGVPLAAVVLAVCSITADPTRGCRTPVLGR
ncbi:hypothetical protein [Actinoplanes sp. NPDC051411]|uniref:hypothetical protein n=1 Tax=Actinoplanes sp. NPDC051411 TaxID=3155522 RepID=UPI003449107D